MLGNLTALLRLTPPTIGELRRFWDFRDRLAPPGSLRRRAYDPMVAPLKRFRPGTERALKGHVDAACFLAQDLLVLCGWFEEAFTVEPHASFRVLHRKQKDGDIARQVVAIHAPSLRAASHVHLTGDGASLVLSAADLGRCLIDPARFAAEFTASDPALAASLLEFTAAATRPAHDSELPRWAREQRKLHELLRPRLAHGRAPAAHVDRVLRLDATRFVAVGWSHDDQHAATRLRIFSPEGAHADLLPAARRIPRDDVARALGGGGELGFIAFFELPHPTFADAGWRLEYASESGAEVEGAVERIERDPRVIRDVLLDALAKKGASGAEPLLRDVLRPAFGVLQSQPHAKPVIRSNEAFGTPNPRPDVSVIVPLYGRLDFVEHQLSDFAADPTFSAAELIYVLDSPEQASHLRSLAHGLYELYRVPFRLVCLERNVGYAGATNAGASVSRAGLLLLLNSDVFPSEPGWLPAMARFYRERADVGALGAQLLYEDGSLQHAGCHFQQFPQSGWNNSHYFKGLPRTLPAAQVSRRVPSVTGACLMVDRALYDAVGGLSQEYVQGDFEDTDFCLRLRRKGRRTWYYSGARLYHLEGQSYPSPARAAAYTYNRWLHEQLWSGEIVRAMREMEGVSA